MILHPYLWPYIEVNFTRYIDFRTPVLHKKGQTSAVFFGKKRKHRSWGHTYTAQTVITTVSHTIAVGRRRSFVMQTSAYGQSRPDNTDHC